jgi:hypothetical protein
LVTAYFRTLLNTINTIQSCKQVIVVAVVPPLKKGDYEKKYGPLPESFPVPFLGTDQDRVRYRTKVNLLLEVFCKQHEYTFFNPYDAYYMEPDGTLKYELSDTMCHIGDNTVFLEEFQKVLL